MGIEGDFEKWVSRVYLHPTIKYKENNNVKELKLLNDMIFFRCSLEKANVKESEWAPEFGKKIPNHFIEMIGKDKSLYYTMQW